MSLHSDIASDLYSLPRSRICQMHQDPGKIGESLREFVTTRVAEEEARLRAEAKADA